MMIMLENIMMIDTDDKRNYLKSEEGPYFDKKIYYLVIYHNNDHVPSFGYSYYNIYILYII